MRTFEIVCMGDLGLGLSLLISEVRLEHKKRDPQQNLTYQLKYVHYISFYIHLDTSDKKGPIYENEKKKITTFQYLILLIDK